MPTWILRVLLLTGAALALAAPPAMGQTAGPRSLAGESFQAAEGLGSSELSVDYDCAAGTAGFMASGTAEGPYPGTFTETGTVAGRAGRRREVLRPELPRAM